MINLTEIKKSSVHGYGVFAIEDIKKNTIVEECVVIKDSIKPDSEILSDYRFVGEVNIDKKEIKSWIILSGNAMMYNSAERREDKNLARVWPYKDRVVSFIAIKDIKKGEELLLYYMVPIDHT
jgi:hypothetical protein